MEHVIVCGLGQVGYRVTKLLLRLGRDVTVIALEARAEFSSDIIELGAHFIQGDARNNRLLLQAGLESAKAVLLCADSDLVNIELALDVRRLAPNVRVVSRLFDQTLSRRLEESIGLHRALAMSTLSAPAFAAAALGEADRGMFEHEGEFYVTDGSQIRTLDLEVSRQRPSFLRHRIAAFRELWKQSPQLLKVVCVVLPILTVASVTILQAAMHLSVVDAFYYVITTLTTTGYGDISPKDGPTWLKLFVCFLMLVGSASVAALYSLITDFIVTSRFNELLGRRAVRSEEHVIVVGLGSVGFRIVEMLVRLGLTVAAIDILTEPKLRRALPPGVAFIAGDGRDADTLELAGIDNAKAILVVTTDDSVNLSAALTARSLSPNGRIVVRLFDGEFARKVEETMEVDRAMSASRIAAPNFVAAALYADAVSSTILNDHLIVVRQGESGVLSTESVPLLP